MCSPTLLLIRGFAQDCVQTACEYLQGWRLHHLPGHPVPVLSHLDSEKMFPDAQREPPVFQLVPIASGPVIGPGSRIFTPCPQAFMYIEKIYPETSLLNGILLNISKLHF